MVGVADPKTDEEIVETEDPSNLRNRNSQDKVEEITNETIVEHETGEQLVGASWQRKLYIKIGFGAGEAGCYIISSVMSFFISSFLLETAQLPATQAGIVILCAELFDAFIDPLAGKASDDTRTRWGRRRPWVFGGSFPLCIAFWFFFLVPPLSGWGFFFYYITLAMFVKVSYGFVAIPYTALTPEITMDYDQRTSLTMWRMILGMIGSVIATAGHAILLTELKTTDENGVDDYSYAYMISIGLWSLVAFFCLMVTVFTVKEKFPQELLSKSRSWKKLFQESKEALLTREYVAVSVMYATSWIAINFVQGNIYLYTKYVLDEEDNFSILLIIIQTVSIVSLFIWKIISGEIGKKLTSYLGVAVLVPVFILFGILGKHQIYLAYATGFLGGIGVGNMLLMPWAMLPDVMEIDELKCGYRREGVFYSWFVFFQKVGIGLSLGLSSLALGWAGYVPPDTQDEDEPQPHSVIITLRLMLSAIPFVLFIITTISIYLFPITKDSHTEATQTVLRNRKDILQEEGISTNSEKSGENTDTVEIELDVISTDETSENN